MGINGHIILCEDYVSFETAKLLKEKGFDEKCRTFYNDKTLKITHIDSSISNEKPFNLCVLAPTLQMAMKWLREVHKIDVCVCRELDDYGGCYDGYIAVVYSNGVYMVTIRDVVKDLSYEEVAELAIKYCLTNII